MQYFGLIHRPCLLFRRHKPSAPFLGCCAFLHAAPPASGVIGGSVRDLMGGWSAGATRALAAHVQPVRMVRMPYAASGGVTEAEAATSTGSGSGGTASVALCPSLPLTGRQLVQLLDEAAEAHRRAMDVRQRMAAAATSAGLPQVAVPLPAGPGGDGNQQQQTAGGAAAATFVRQGSGSSSASYVVLGAQGRGSGGGVAQARSSGGGSAGSTVLVPSAPPPSSSAASSPAICITALNSHCPLGNRSVHPQHPSAPATPHPPSPASTSQPLWLLHDETGSTLGNVRRLAAALPMPVYGLNLPDLLPTPAPTSSTSSPSAPWTAAALPTASRLAEMYAAAVVSVQPYGPYLIGGTSGLGCLLAAATAAALEARGHDVGLLLMDGPPCAVTTAGGAGAAVPVVAAGGVGSGGGSAAGGQTVPLVDPLYASIYQTLVYHRCIASSGSVEDGSVGLPDVTSFAATLQSRGAAAGGAALLAAAAAFRPVGMPAEAWEAEVLAAERRAPWLRVLAAGCTPRAALQCPAAAVLPEDRYGSAFLAAARAACEGSLTAVTLEARHCEVLAGEEEAGAAAAAVAECVGELLHMV